jgi:putative peptide zinc metalloprotease protein
MLPPLREELTLHDGPSAADGSPTWSLHDPVRNKFFRIDWTTFLVLSHWHLGQPRAICAAVQSKAPIELTDSDVDAVEKFLAQSELLQCFDAAASHRLALARRRTHHAAWTWLVHHYLFFRIPIFRPDAWLTRVAPHLGVFYSRGFLRLTLAALAIGLVGTLRQFPHFKATFVDTLTWEGLTAYAGVLIGIKALHELGHAFTAKRFGCRVPTMGIAFLVLWPVAYTDVNETWKLASRQKRLAIGGAGILTELAVAAWATLAWVLLPDGPLRSGAFLLAAVTWISTLAINASPFMRFDGYFLLSDWLDIPNLHDRAFALARWRLREWLFAIDEEKPECFSTRRERFLIAFAVLTWVYRLMLFLGIAVLIYRHTFKALGIVLFAVEMVWFVVLPVAREFGEWQKRWPVIRTRRRSRQSLAIAAGFLAIIFVPFDMRVSAQAVLRPAKSVALYAPEAGILLEAPRSHGSTIRAGEIAAKLFSPELEYQTASARARRESVAAQLRAAALDSEVQDKLPILREQLAALDTELAGLEQESLRLAPVAEFTAVVVDPLLDAHPGDTIARNERLMTLVDGASWEVRAFFTERDVARITPGAAAIFYPETPGAPPLELRVESIDRDASRELEEASLASLHGGEIPVHASQHALIPQRSMFGIRLTLKNPNAVHEIRQLRGRVVVRARPKTLFFNYFETAAAVAIRESSW